jgi:hypothetical protein
MQSLTQSREARKEEKCFQRLFACLAALREIILVINRIRLAGRRSEGQLVQAFLLKHLGYGGLELRKVRRGLDSLGQRLR